MSKAVITDLSIPYPALRDVVRAYTIKEHFPLHLEAVRVLILMMMNNPDLSFETLPPTPSPDELIGAISPSSLAGDPLVVNSRARAISSRQRWNPFYRLLADGATMETRKVITDYCPTLDQKPDRNRPGWLWRWETDEEKERAISYSGGWDCVFVGLLYNKMRVEKPLADQLLARFEAILRALTNGLGSAPDQLKKAKAALVEANKRAADAQKALDDARDQSAKAEQQAIDQFDAERRRLESLIGDLHSKIGRLATQLRSLPNCPRFAPCGQILDPVRQLNRPIEEAIDRVNRDLAAANNQHNDAVRKIEEARARIKAWTDQKLGEAERQALQEQQRLVKLTDDLETFMKLAPQAKTQTVSFLKTWKQDRNH